MTRFKTSRWRSSFLVVVFIATLLTTIFSGLVTKAPDAYAASIGTCTMTTAFAINNCSFDSTLNFGSGAGNAIFDDIERCGPVILDNLVTYEIVVGSKIAAGGYNGTIKTTLAGPCVGTSTYNGAITINDPNGVGPGGGNPGSGGGGGGGGGGANAPPSCESQGGDLAWILCGIFNEVGSVTQWIIKNIIQPFLITAPVSTNPADPSYKIWSNFRIYGDVFLVFALLVIVFGQSIGGGLVDAYTAKKVLPRLLIAAILINLSVYVVAFLVDITNILGQGVGNLITEPLRSCAPQTAPGNNQCWNFALTQPQEAGVFGIGIIGLFVGGAGAAAGLLALGSLTGGGAAIGALFFVLLPMLLAVVAVFVTLIIRKGIILVLLLISPVAFALYCLPNTEKYFRKWWDALLETLMVYPIVMAVFAVAELLSVTVLQASKITPDNLNNGGQFLTKDTSPILAVVIAFIAQFLPLFLIPFAFRMAGGLLGRVHEFSSNAGNRVKQSGWYDRNRKDSSRKWQQQHVEGSRRMFTAAANSRLGNVPIVGNRYIKNRAERYDQRARTMGMDFMKDPRFQAIQYDGDALKAGTYATRGAAIAGLQKDYGLTEEKAMSAVQRFQGTGMGFGEATAVAAFQAAIQDGTTFNGGKRRVRGKDGNFVQATEEDRKAKLADADGNKLEEFSSMQEMVETAARVGGNNASTRASLAGFANTYTKQSGRHDMAPGFGTLKGLIDGAATGGANAPTTEDYDNALVEAFRGTSNPQLSGNKLKSIENGSSAMARTLNRNQEIITNRSVAEASTAQYNARQRAMDPSHTDVTTETYVAMAQRANAQITAKAKNMETADLYAPEVITAAAKKGLYGEVKLDMGDFVPVAPQVNVMDSTMHDARTPQTQQATVQDSGGPIHETRRIVDPATGREAVMNPLQGATIDRELQQQRGGYARGQDGGPEPPGA